MAADNVNLNDAVKIPPTPSQPDDSPVPGPTPVRELQETRPEIGNVPAAEPEPMDAAAVSEDLSPSSESAIVAEGGTATLMDQKPVAAEDQENPEEDESLVPAALFRQVQLEKEELYDRLLRKQAEFENFRKRLERDRQDHRDYALFQFIKDLLPVIDGLERSLEAPEGESVEGYKKGIELILKQFRESLATVGLQPIRAIGRIFDPNYHQAVLREESAILAENEVIEELQRGYTFKDRLLRPSMVKVAVPAAPAAPEDKPVETEV